MVFHFILHNHADSFEDCLMKIVRRFAVMVVLVPKATRQRLESLEAAIETLMTREGPILECLDLRSIELIAGANVAWNT
jgi:hypothetical protein